MTRAVYGRCWSVRSLRWWYDYTWRWFVDVLFVVLILAAWIALQYFVLPRLGVPT